MNEEAIEKMKIDKIKESISETEEEIGVEVFVNVVEEENVREEEIIEKIEKCEKLKREYIEKIEKLRQKSNEENSCYDKVTANLSEEINKLRKMKAKLESKRINAGRKVGATSSAADDNEKINRKITETNKAREAGVAAASANEKIEREIAETNKAREADVAATSAKEKAEEEAFAAKKAKEAFAKTEEEAAAAKKVQEEAAVAKKKAIDEVAKKVEAKTFAVKKMVEEAAAEKAAEEVAIKEAAKTRRKDTSAVEREANVKETYGDVLEHDIKLLPNHAQLGNEVMIEVAAAFPLLQAQRGESVAPSLNLPQIPIKKNETKEKGIEHAEDDIIMDTRRINEKPRKQNSDADEDEEISLDRKRISKKAPDIDEKADDKKQKVAMMPALINAAQVNVNVSAISYNQFVEYVGDCESPDIKVEKDKLCFKGNGGVNKKDYDVKLKFFKKIDPEKSKYDVQPRAFDFALQKKDARPYWNRLLETKVKQHWLQVDFSKWKEEDDSSDESSGALPTEYRQIYIVNKKYVEFVMDSEPDVSVKPREGIGVYRDSANTLTPSKFLINVDKFFKGSMLAANNEKSPNFNRSYVCSKKLNYTSLAIIRDAFRWRGWSGSSLNLNLLVGRGMHGRGAQVERFETVPQFSGG